MLRVAALRHDLASIRRRFSRRPAEFIVPGLTLALVIGVGTAVFAVIDATMLRPLPFPDADRLVRVFTMAPGATESRSRQPLASIDFVRFRSAMQTLDRLEVIWQRERGITGSGDPLIVKAGSVSAGFFDVLGGRTLIGRTFTAQEDESDTALAVLSYGLWQRMFAADPSVIGRQISLDGEPHEVIGVMTREFEPAYRESELWTTLGVNAHNLPLPNATYLVSVGRLAAGRSLGDARQEFGALMDEVGREAPNRRGWTAGVVTLREYQFGDRRAVLLTVLAMVGLLIALTATNITSFTFAIGMTRQGECALRRHLGAGTFDVLRLLGIEALLVYGCATIAGVLLAAVCLPAIMSLDPDLARVIGAMPVDWRAEAAACVVAMLLASLAGVWPAFRAMRVNSGDRERVSRSRHATRVQHVLVALQTTIATVVLIVGAGLLESYARMARADRGIDASGVMTAQVRLSSAYATHEQRIAFMDGLLDTLRRTPGVLNASSVSSPFVPGLTYVTGFEVENEPSADGQMHRANFRRVAPNYFATLHIRLLDGRDILASDRRTTPWVAVVSQSLATRVWPGRSALGHRIRRLEPGTGWMTVVGIVDDVKDVGLNEGPDPTLYVSQEQHLPATLAVALVVRAQDPTMLPRQIRAAMASIDNDQVVDRFVGLDAYLRRSLASQRFQTTLVAAFALAGLLLVVVGLAGLTARSVVERRREIGIRIALGSSPSRLGLTVTRDALAGVAIGAAAGLAASIATVHTLRTVIPNFTVPSPTVLLADVLTIFALCALVAAVPARRATRIPPSVALRVE